MRLKDKLVVITAAASGMGKAGCELFAREGASVAAVDINERGAQEVARSITERGGKAFALHADLTSNAECREIVSKAARLLGGIDVLWSHAGEPGPANIENLDMDAYERSMALNVRSSVVLAGEVVGHLRKRGGGSIVFTSSASGLVGSPFSPVYSAAKFAIVGLTKSLALALAGDSIRVNTVCPGPTDTAMLKGFTARDGSDATHVANLAALTGTVPLRRVGRPDEMAHAALWLASDDASYVTGVALPVDGGMTAR